MKVAAIIAEYNPFHSGHAYQIAKTKEITGADYVLVIMSGNFVQRGTPAIYNKYIRTKMALTGGADVVIELPSLYACASAEFFAGGAVCLLNKLGCIDYLSFGSECGDISLLKDCAKLLHQENSNYQTVLSDFMKQGLSYPVARYRALLHCHFTGETLNAAFSSPEQMEAVFSSPNNILALEYCKALKACNSNIAPVTIKRYGDDYHTTTLNASVHPSATAVRTQIEKGKLLADYPSAFLSCDDFSSLLQYKLLCEKENGFTSYLDCNKELSDKIIKYLPEFTCFSQFCQLLKSKDLTYTRINRVLLHILLNIKKQDCFSMPLDKRTLPTPYVRLLGFQKKSSALLSVIKEKSQIPLLSKPADAQSLLENFIYPDTETSVKSALSMLLQDIFTEDIYEAVFADKYNKRPSANAYRQSPVII